jgi:hypothetical protein
MNRVKIAILIYLSIIAYIILFKPSWVLNGGRKQLKSFGFKDSDTLIPMSILGPLLGIIIYLVVLFLDINLSDYLSDL